MGESRSKIMYLEMLGRVNSGEEIDERGYYTLCQKAGVSREDKIVLYKERYDLGRKLVEGELEQFLTKEKGERKYNIEEVTRIAFAPFPNHELFEQELTESQITERLRAIKRTGYPVDPYSALTAQRKRNYLLRLQKEISEESKKHCPDVLEEVKQGLKDPEGRYSSLKER